ncbi:hypothetical protein [Actinomycetospora cinnamomea]|uniref:Uncharacterized protein n=1 Tax=Actinomycetospora cinnamomea TaxID=663609 RepID=A0A2U1FA67_9PSEU|nr:hypothetical protein [Actinomycetospora cinnamomea]PVZ09064.1 hypothetical protein C8D89_107228 [Actinomycetospora cinnamomea]
MTSEMKTEMFRGTSALSGVRAKLTSLTMRHVEARVVTDGERCGTGPVLDH